MYLTLLRVLPDEVIVRVTFSGGFKDLRLTRAQSIRIDRLAQSGAQATVFPPVEALPPPAPPPPPSGPPLMTYVDPSYLVGKS